MIDLSGKAAFVTGGGSGIGDAVARQFIKLGAKVGVAGRRTSLLDKLADECGARLAARIASASVNLCAAMTLHEPPKTLLSRSLNWAIQSQAAVTLLCAFQLHHAGPPFCTSDGQKRYKD